MNRNPTVWRSLCAELVSIVEHHAPAHIYDLPYEAAAMQRARAALAQPEPQGPSGDEIYKLALDGDFLIDIGDGFSCAVQDEVGFARAVLARFGRPTIEPVAEVAIPGEEYHEDLGAVLWWRFPVDEPPWCGSPNDSDWPGYHTHFTPLPPVPSLPVA